MASGHCTTGTSKATPRGPLACLIRIPCAKLSFRGRAGFAACFGIPHMHRPLSTPFRRGTHARISRLHMRMADTAVRFVVSQPGQAPGGWQLGFVEARHGLGPGSGPTSPRMPLIMNATTCHHMPPVHCAVAFLLLLCVYLRRPRPPGGALRHKFKRGPGRAQWRSIPPRIKISILAIAVPHAHLRLPQGPRAHARGHREVPSQEQPASGGAGPAARVQAGLAAAATGHATAAGLSTGTAGYIRMCSGLADATAAVT